MRYNFARIHKTLRVTPTMAAGISSHVWLLEERSPTLLNSNNLRKLFSLAYTGFSD